MVGHPIAEGRGGLELSPAGLFRHALPDFLPQVDGVVLCHSLQHGFQNEAHPVVLQMLGDAHHLDPALPAEHGLVDNAVLPVPGEAVKLVDQDDRKGGRLLFCGGDHGHEGRAGLGPAACDPCVDVDVVGGEGHPVLAGVMVQGPFLGVRGVFGLILGGDPDVAGGNGVHGHPPFSSVYAAEGHA